MNANRLGLFRNPRHQDLLPLATIAIDGYAFASELVSQHEHIFNVLACRRAAEIRGLAYGTFNMSLKDGLHPDVPLRRNIMRSNEDSANGLGDFSCLLCATRL